MIYSIKCCNCLTKVYTDRHFGRTDDFTRFDRKKFKPKKTFKILQKKRPFGLFLIIVPLLKGLTIRFKNGIYNVHWCTSNTFDEILKKSIPAPFFIQQSLCFLPDLLVVKVHVQVLSLLDPSRFSSRKTTQVESISFNWLQVSRVEKFRLTGHATADFVKC